MTDELVVWLRGCLDEDEARAVRMREAVWPERVAVMAQMDTGRGEPVGSVGVAPGAAKVYLRLWEPDDRDDLIVDHGHRLHEDAVEVWSKDVAARVLAEVAAKRRTIEAYEAMDETASDPVESGWAQGLGQALHLLASVYRGRPGWRSEWAPDDEENRG